MEQDTYSKAIPIILSHTILPDRTTKTCSELDPAKNRKHERINITDTVHCTGSDLQFLADFEESWSSLSWGTQEHKSWNNDWWDVRCLQASSKESKGRSRDPGWFRFGCAAACKKSSVNLHGTLLMFVICVCGWLVAQFCTSVYNRDSSTKIGTASMAATDPLTSLLGLTQADWPDYG